MRLKVIGLVIGGAVLVLTAIGTWACGAYAGPDPAAIFADARTIELARAITAGQAAEVRQLVRSEADLSAQGQGGVTPLQWAMLRDRPDMVRLLLDLGANPAQKGYGKQTAVHMAATAKDKPFLEILLTHGVSPDLKGGPTDAPALSEAVMNRNHDAVALLLEHRANPNLADRQGETPLHVAALINDYTAMLALLKAGANTMIRDNLGKTFAAYFAIQPKDNMVSGETRAQRKAVHDWLAEHGHAGMNR